VLSSNIKYIVALVAALLIVRILIETVYSYSEESFNVLQLYQPKLMKCFSF